MSSLGRAIAEAGRLPIERLAKVTSIFFESGHWTLGIEDGRTFQSRHLVSTIPPPQAAELFREAAPHAVEVLESFDLEPCLALAARYPRRELDWRGIQLDDPRISWIGHDTSKRPDLHAGKTVVVIHGASDFSRSRFEEPEEKIRERMLEAASELSGRELRDAEACFLQRWRYATTTGPVSSSKAVRIDAPAPLVLAGESFGGGKVEGAWLSGQHAAELLGGI